MEVEAKEAHVKDLESKLQALSTKFTAKDKAVEILFNTVKELQNEV
jgi:hypothetical protein